MDIEQVKRQEYKKALDKALRLLLNSDRTVHELRSRLEREGYTEAITQSVVDYLIQECYLDDKRYAEYYVVCYKEKRSRKRIHKDLTDKGVDNSIIELFIDECDDKLALEKALNKQLSKHCIESVSDVPWNIRQKISAALYRQGFRSDDIGRLF